MLENSMLGLTRPMLARVLAVNALVDSSGSPHGHRRLKDLEIAVLEGYGNRCKWQVFDRRRVGAVRHGGTGVGEG
jgi:hypothetical protein